MIQKALPYLSMAALLVLLGMSIKSCFTPQRPLMLAQTMKPTADSTQFWKDATGREHARALVAESNLATLQVYYAPLVDSVLHTLKLQGNKLDAITAISTETHGTIRPRVDTILVKDQPALHFRYNDKWLDMDGTLATGDPVIKYSTRDSLVFTHYRKRRGFLHLGRQDTYLDGYSINPNSHVTGITDLHVITEKPKRFGIGPYIGYGFDGQRWAPSLGFSIQYSLIKF